MNWLTVSKHPGHLGAPLPWENCLFRISAFSKQPTRQAQGSATEFISPQLSNSSCRQEPSKNDRLMRNYGETPRHLGWMPRHVETSNIRLIPYTCCLLSILHLKDTRELRLSHKISHIFPILLAHLNSVSAMDSLLADDADTHFTCFFT